MHEEQPNGKSVPCRDCDTAPTSKTSSLGKNTQKKKKKKGNKTKQKIEEKKTKQK
jgi:hypothetical protein